MFCTNCGAQVEDGNKFCTACGAKMEEAEAVQSQNYITPQQNVDVDYGMESAAAKPSTSPMIGGIMGIVVILLGILSLFNPTGGGVGFLYKYMEGPGTNFFMKALYVPVRYLEAGADGDAGAAGIFAGLFGFIGGFILIAAIVLLIIYVIGALGGKNRARLARVAMIMCIVVAAMFILAPMMMNSAMEKSAKDVDGILGMSGNAMYAYAFVSELSSDAEINEEKMNKALGMDDVDTDDMDLEDVQEEMEKVEKKMKKKFDPIVSPTIWDWLFLISAIGGVVLIKKKD